MIPMETFRRLLSKVSSWLPGRPPPPAPPTPYPSPPVVQTPPPLLLATLSQHLPEPADIESGLRSAPSYAGPRLAEKAATAEGGKEYQGKPSSPFHERMTGWTTSIAACLVGLAFLLLLHVASIPSAVLPVFCYLAMVDFMAGSCIFFLHVARPPGRAVARIQVTAAALGVTAAALEGIVLCYLFLAPAQFWGLAVALIVSTVGFTGYAVLAGSGDDPDLQT